MRTTEAYGSSDVDHRWMRLMRKFVLFIQLQTNKDSLSDTTFFRIPFNGRYRQVWLYCQIKHLHMYTGLTLLYIHHLYHSEDSFLVHVSMHNCVLSLYRHHRLPPKMSLVVYVSMHNCVPSLYRHPRLPPNISLVVHVSMRNCVPSLYRHPRLSPKISLVQKVVV